jgi:hypothetical protein
MKKSLGIARSIPRARVAALVAALVAVGAVTAFLVGTASAQGRTLTGQFGFDTSAASGQPYYHQCGPPMNPGFTISLTEDGEPVTSLEPGTYWLTVTDNCKNHNFELRSCPGSDSPCDPSSGGVEQELTPMNDPSTANGATGTVTVKIHLVHGTYRLFCDAPVAAGGTHETVFGMYADVNVGGVGQVG